MQMTPAEYNAYVTRLSPKSPLWKDCLNAFWIGGLICVIGQLIGDGIKLLDWGEDQTAAATSAVMIFLGALFTGLNLYDDVAKVAGAGTIVPITGFANSIVSPAMEFKSEGLVLGVGAKMFSIAGPVLVYGFSQCDLWTDPLDHWTFLSRISKKACGSAACLFCD